MRFKTKEASVDVGWLIESRHVIGCGGEATQVAVINDHGKVYMMGLDQLSAFFVPADGDAEAFMEGVKQRAEDEKKMLHRPFPPMPPPPEAYDLEHWGSRRTRVQAARAARSAEATEKGLTVDWLRFSNPISRRITVERGAEMLAASEEIRHLHVSEGMTLDDAAKVFARRHPDVALRAMERLGSWPSSEPELAALQRTWR